MIRAIFVVSASGEVLVEKQLLDVVPRAVINGWFEKVGTTSIGGQKDPITEIAPYYLVSVQQNDIWFVGVLKDECFPLMATEYLDRLVSIIKSYVGPNLHERTVKEYFALIYQLLDETCDAGIPMNTDTNVIQTLVRPEERRVKKSLKKVRDKLGALRKDSDKDGIEEDKETNVLPTEATSAIPWRPKVVKHVSPSIFFDVIETVSGTVDAAGRPVVLSLRGSIRSNSRLSETPQVICRLDQYKMLTSTQLHPCVLLRMWEREHKLTFIPPDGEFILMRYSSMLPTTVTLPLQLNYIYTKPCLADPEGSQDIMSQELTDFISLPPMRAGTLSLSIGHSTGGKLIDAKIFISMPLGLEASIIEQTPNCTISSDSLNPLKLNTYVSHFVLSQKEITGTDCSIKCNVRLDRNAFSAMYKGVVLADSFDEVLTRRPSVSMNLTTDARESLSKLSISGVSVTQVSYKCDKMVRYIVRCKHVTIE